MHGPLLHYIKARIFLEKLGDYYISKNDSAPPIQETLFNVDIWMAYILQQRTRR
jgi:hypothetical protein